MFQKTTTCNVMSHLEFSYHFDPSKSLEQDANWLRRLLEESVVAGRRYKARETLQLGWMINYLIEREDNSLGIFEPDFQALPIVWKDSVTMTLQHLRLQKSVVESVGLVNLIDFPSIRQSALIGTDVTQQVLHFVLERVQEEKEMDSGWFIGDAETKCDYNDPANLRRLSLYEIGLLLPRLVMFYALPAGCRVLASEAFADIYYHGKSLPMPPETFLGRLVRG